MTSPEAFLRRQVSPDWSSEAICASPDSIDSETLNSIPLRLCVTTWDQESYSFEGRIRAYRYNLVPDNWEDLPSCRPTTTSQLARRVLYIANQKWFFSDGIPPLQVAQSSTPIDGVTSLSFLLEGAPGPEPFQYLSPGKSPPGGSWSGYRKCLCMAFLFESGNLKYEQWTTVDTKTSRSHWGNPFPNTQPAVLLPKIIELCQAQHCCRAAISDGTATLLLSFQTAFVDIPEERRILGHIVCKYGDPLQLSLTFLFYIEASKSGICGMRFSAQMDLCLGVLDDPKRPLTAPTSLLQRESFSEFDLYTMQRDERFWEQWNAWRTQKRSEAVPLLAGDTLLADANSFLRNSALLRSPIPFPDVSEDTLSHVRCDSRPIDTVALDLVTGSPTFTFHIESAIRATDESYSQVFLGTVSGQDSRRSGRICLKLYDERYFVLPSNSAVAPWIPFPTDPISDPVRAAQVRLYTWNVAEDLARREESAYDRLRAFQGSLVPHSYGFHRFTLPDGHRCLGFLMEFVEGMSVEECGVRDMSTEIQRQFILNARHGLRVIRYAQIHQTDWHAGQFIVRKFGGTESEPCRFGIVFIDFAFALQHMDMKFTPTVMDWDACRNCFADVFEHTFLLETWFAPDENEY